MHDVKRNVRNVHHLAGFYGVLAKKFSRMHSICVKTVVCLPVFLGAPPVPRAIAHNPCPHSQYAAEPLKTRRPRSNSR